MGLEKEGKNKEVERKILEMGTRGWKNAEIHDEKRATKGQNERNGGDESMRV